MPSRATTVPGRSFSASAAISSSIASSWSGWWPKVTQVAEGDAGRRARRLAEPHPVAPVVRAGRVVGGVDDREIGAVEQRERRGLVTAGAGDQVGDIADTLAVPFDTLTGDRHQVVERRRPDAEARGRLQRLAGVEVVEL